MDLALLTVIGIVAVALLFDYTNGFHDSANSIFTIEPQTATDHSPGAISTLITADGGNMVVNYATNLDGRSQSPTPVPRSASPRKVPRRPTSSG